MERTHVPCNGCRACCIGQAVLLYPSDGDVISSYETEITPHPLTGEPAHMLRHNADGSCVYLGPEGCTIYDRAPAVCRSFDCRIAFLEWSNDRAERRRMLKASNDPVMHAGSKRAATVTAADFAARAKEIERYGIKQSASAALLRLGQATRADIAGAAETPASARPRAR